jgi:hypothetical protein
LSRSASGRLRDREAAAGDPGRVSRLRFCRDFSEALAALLGKDAPGLSPTAIAGLKDGWLDEYDCWRKLHVHCVQRRPAKQADSGFAGPLVRFAY